MGNDLFISHHSLSRTSPPPLHPFYLFVIDCLCSFLSRFAGFFRFGHFGAFTCLFIFVLLFQLLAYALKKD